jgi:ATP-dependent Clp protease protease subunit
MPKLINISKPQNMFTVINKTETVAEILMYGAIGSSNWDDNTTSAKQFAEALKALPAGTKEIHLRVNSPGGSVFDGMAIFENLKSQKTKHNRKIIAYVDGVAASIASVIIQAADEIIIGDGGMVMIHKPMVGAQGNVSELERMIVILDKIEEQMITIYAKKTGMSRNELSVSLANETWYTSDEAIEAGLADSKIEARDTLQLAASMIEGCSWMKNKPKFKSQNDIAREKLRDFTSKANAFLKK